MPDSTGQTKRLQSAVREMLADIRDCEESDNLMRITPQELSTLEDYGLTWEDME